MVAFLPTLQGIVQQRPDVEIVLVCTPVGREIAKSCVPDATFVTVDYRAARSWRAIVRILLPALRRCRAHRYVVSLHSYDEPSFAYMLAAAAGVRWRIGFNSGIAKLQFLLTELLPFDPRRNVADINFDLVRRIACSRALRPRRVPLRYASSDVDAVARRLRYVGIAPGERFIAIHGGAKLAYKEWGVARYLELGQRLEQKSKRPVVVVEDGTLRFAGAPRVVRTATLGELACLLERSALLICNNSGPMNIAAAMGTPCVVMQGPSPRSWDIFWDDVPHRVLRADHLGCVPCETLASVPGRCLNRDYPMGCMKEISVETVERNAEDLLATACAVRDGKS